MVRGKQEVLETGKPHSALKWEGGRALISYIRENSMSSESKKENKDSSTTTPLPRASERQKLEMDRRRERAKFLRDKNRLRSTRRA